jgi:CRP-like cAMP-binding protein
VHHAPPLSPLARPETGSDLAHALEHLFPSAAQGSRRALAEQGRTRVFARRDRLLREDAQPAILLLHDGFAGTWRSDAEGHAQLVSLSGPGDVAGLLSLGPHRVAAEVDALTPGLGTSWPASTMLALAMGDAGLGADLLQESLRAAERLMTRLEHVGFDPVGRRLARLLWQRREVLFDARRPLLTRPQLADLVGATREMTDRALRDLEREGIVRRVNRTGLVLLDGPALQRRADVDGDERECS